MTNPIDHEDLYNKYTLAGVRCPGVVTLSGLASVTKWDVQEAKGQDGASVTRQGRPLAKFTATHSLVIDPVQGVNEIEEWRQFLPLLKSLGSGGAAPTAADFYHPDAADLDVRSVVVESIGQLQHDGMGGATVAVQFLEYAPPKPKTSKGASGSKPNPPHGTVTGTIDPPDPNQEYKEELEKLVAKAKEP